MSDGRRSNIPIPDPSLLTTEQLRRELLSLREFLLSRMDQVERVHEEKFRAIETRFSENKEALNVAFVSQKTLFDSQNITVADAAKKTEDNFSRQLVSLEALTKTSTSALAEKVEGIDRRLNTFTSTSQGAVDNTTRIIAMVVLILTMGMFALTLYNSISNHPTAIITSPVR